MDFASQSIGLSTVINARDLGGYVLPDGRTVKRGLLLRGGDLARASDEDISILKDRYHLARIFDFRTSMEVTSLPDREVPGAGNIWMPAFNEKSSKMAEMVLPREAYVDLGGWLVENAKSAKVQSVARSMYAGLVTDDFTQMQYAGFLQNIVNTLSGAVYWHCSQGKDRTGIAAALVLTALGADRELVMADYNISNEFYREDVAHYCSLVDTAEEREAIWTFIGVNPRYFGQALDLLEAEYGSLMEFLTGPLCLTQEDISILRERYTE